METPLKSYNNGIATDATDAVCAKAERLWTAEIELQRLVKTVERARRAFIKSVVKETWILPLKEESTFYNKFPLATYSTTSRTASAASRPLALSPSCPPYSAGGPTTHASPST